jgi:hypothetical protein
MKIAAMRMGSSETKKGTPASETKMKEPPKAGTKMKEPPKAGTKMKEPPKAGTTMKDGGTKKTKKDPRRLLLGGCPKQFAKILELVAPLRYYDDPPYDELAELIDVAIKKTNVKVS